MVNNQEVADEKSGAVIQTSQPGDPAGKAEPVEPATSAVISKTLNEAADQVSSEPALLAEPGGSAAEKPLVPVPEQPPAKKPPAVSEDLIKDYTEALVATLDVVNGQVCSVIARQMDHDFSFKQSQHDKLVMVWTPVVRMFYDKIPVLVVAGFTTVTVLGGNFIAARQLRDEKDQKK
ncbi:MAG TPA: hypothetical protein VF399_11990 [bacterium]